MENKSVLEDNGSFTPFINGGEQDGDLNLNELEREILESVQINIWPFFAGCTAGEEPEKCVVKIHTFYCKDSTSETGVDLIDILRKSFTGDDFGERAEIIALTKLVTGINEIIAKLVIDATSWR